MRVTGLPPPRLSRRQIPVLVLAVCLTATAVAGYVVQRVVNARNLGRFGHEVTTVSNRLEEQLERYVATLRAASALVMSGLQDRSPGDKVRLLGRFARDLDLGRHLDGARGLGYVPGGLDDNPTVTVFQAFGNEPVQPPRPEMLAETDQRAAMERARDSGTPSLSARVRAVPDTDTGPRFVLFMPVYGTPEPPTTLEQRRSSLDGFVFVPFRAEEFFRSLEGALDARGVAFRVYDGTEPLAAAQLWSSQEDAVFRASHFNETRAIAVAGHQWLLTFGSLPALETDSGQPLVPVFLVGGIALAILLAVVSSAQVRARALAEAVMAERSLLLERERDARAEAQMLNQLGRTIGAELDLDKLVQSIVDGATELVGAGFGALFYQGGVDTDVAVSKFPRELLDAMPSKHPAQVPVPGLEAGESVVRVDDVQRDPRFRLQLPPGHPPVRSYLAAAVLSRSGETLGGLLFGHDVPGRFHAGHERLIAGIATHAAIAIDNARLYRQSQQALATRDEFFSVASHELRTPLTSLRLQIEGTLHQVVRGEPLSTAKLTTRLESSLRQISRISGLIDRMLDLSRIEQGRLVMDSEELDLGEMLRELTQRFDHEAERCGSSIVLRCPEPIIGVWDRLRLEQVASNLLSNALKYGGGRPVELDAARDHDVARLIIRDHGIGIARSDQARLFGQFERLVSSRNFSGFGLGLWVSRRIVEEMGGAIAVSSELGAGSTFVVTLPLRRTAVANSRQQQTSATG